MRSLRSMSYAGEPAPDMKTITFDASTFGAMQDGDVHVSQHATHPPQEAFQAAALFLNPLRERLDGLWPQD